MLVQYNIVKNFYIKQVSIFELPIWSIVAGYIREYKFFVFNFSLRLSTCKFPRTPIGGDTCPKNRLIRMTE